MSDLHNIMIKRRDEEITSLRAQLAEARRFLEHIAAYKNYATDGDIETSKGVIHVSEFAAEYLRDYPAQADNTFRRDYAKE